MIYIATALYIEASPWIQTFSLKKQIDFTKFQLFSNDNIRLIITGVGELRSAIALTSLFEKYPPTINDIFLNFGLCGCQDHAIQLGSNFICNKIKQYSTNRTLYPDMLFSHSLKEASIETVSQPVHNSKDKINITELLVDMESYSLMLTASYYMQAHQVLFLKVVSDLLDEASELISQNQANQWLQHGMEAALTIPVIYECLKNPIIFSENYELSPSLNSLYESICKSLSLTETMCFSLRQHILYYQCSHTDSILKLTQIISSPEIKTCKTKVERKRYFEQIKQLLME